MTELLSPSESAPGEAVKAAPIGAYAAGKSLARLSVGRDNNLNLTRMIAASSVLFSHAYPITGTNGGGDPLYRSIGYTFGNLAVIVFFVISGFLITKSFNNGRGVGHWVLSRFMRMAPGLFVVLMLTVFVLGPAVTTLPLAEYFTNRTTLAYIPGNLSLWFAGYDLPGVFEHAPYPRAVNGSLWTLLFEVMCYGGVFVTGIAGLLARRRWFALALVPYLISYGLIVATGPHTGGLSRIDALASLSFAFVLGMAAYLWRDRVVLDWRIGAVLAMIAAAAGHSLFHEAALWIAIGYATLYFAYKPKGPLLAYNRLGDYSYGVYISAFPIQQLVVHFLPGQHWYENAAIAYPLTLAYGYCSWNLIEKPALALVRGKQVSLHA